jgi:membrane-associated protease RseP (regulator of RpoE activity)
MLIPTWVWLIGVLAVTIPHEFSHGIACRLAKIKIKSVGWFLLFVIPGAFVEPDEKAVSMAKTSIKLKIHSSGSFANIIFGFVILLVATAMFASFCSPAGLAFQTTADSPANITGLSGALISLGGENVSSAGQVAEILSGYKPGEVIEVTTAHNNWLVPTLNFNGSLNSLVPRYFILTDFNETKTLRIALAKRQDNESRAYLGLTNLKMTYSPSFGMDNYLFVSMLLLWLFIFSFGIGLINLLPMKPFDGGYVMEDILEKTGKKRAAGIVVRAVSTFMLLIILFNLIGPVLMGFV